MIKTNNLIDEKLLTQVNRDNYFVWKKAQMLCKLICLFLAVLLLIITPAHYLDFAKHPILVVGDVLGIIGLLVSILFLRKGNVFLSGMVTVITLMMIPILHNVIGDWLFPYNVNATRFFETLIMISFLLTLIIIYSIDGSQIIVGSLLAVSSVLGHFFVLRLVVGVDVPYTYLLYILLPLAIAKVAHTNLRIVNDAIEALVKSKNQMTGWNKILEETVEQRTNELVEINNKLETLSITDGLTGIGNRRHFDNVLNTEWSRAQRTASNLALIIGDVDWFKNFNDIYGHQSGDECLRLVAKVFKDNAKRESDTVARYGGEEFAALLPVNTVEQAVSFAEMLIRGFRELNLPHSGSKFGYVTISLGIAVVSPNSNQNIEDFVQAADAALYLAKNKGRNQYVLRDNE